MLGYRTVKPHDPAACVNCGPMGPGHFACQNPDCPGAAENDGGRRAAVRAIRRHATEAEYAALPLAHMPIDGVAHQAVYACDDCAEDAFEPFCTHPQPEPQPCPTCAAVGDNPCLKRDGATPRTIGPHAERPAAQPPRCDHAHREDCEVFTHCRCAEDDAAPDRPKRPAQLDAQPDISRLVDPLTLPLAQMILHRHGVSWVQIKSVASVWTQDNEPALEAQVRQLDGDGHLLYDVHGHEVVESVVIPLVVPPQG